MTTTNDIQILNSDLSEVNNNANLQTAKEEIMLRLKTSIKPIKYGMLVLRVKHKANINSQSVAERLTRLAIRDLTIEQNPICNDGRDGYFLATNVADIRAMKNRNLSFAKSYLKKDAAYDAMIAQFDTPQYKIVFKDSAIPHESK